MNYYRILNFLANHFQPVTSFGTFPLVAGPSLFIYNDMSKLTKSTDGIWPLLPITESLAAWLYVAWT